MKKLNQLSGLSIIVIKKLGYKQQLRLPFGVRSDFFNIATPAKLKFPVLDLQQPSPQQTSVPGKLLQSNDVVISFAFNRKSNFATLK